MTDAGQVGERRVVAVLFADIAGFTAMAERMDPEAVTDAVNEIFRALGAEVEAVGGHVDKVIGDSLMALFGAPVAHEDDARRAVRAALAMHRALRDREAWVTRLMGQPVRLRVGIHSGTVVWDVVGPGEARQTVMGDVVNLASRLQRAAPEGGVLVSDAVYRQVRGAYLGKPWEPITVKGRAEPVAVYEILGERERPEPVARPPFVDRADDLHMLAELWERARRGRAQVVMVLGEPGVGKTRLAEEFLAPLPEDVTVLQTSCPPYGGASLGPLADLFQQLAGLRGPVTVRDVEARIPFGERAAQAALVLSRLFGLAEVPPGSDVPHETALLVAAEAIRRMVTRPMAVWIEDLQWADAGTRELLPYMVERMPDAPMLLIGTMRSDAESLVWGRRIALATLQLEPLADEHARAFLAALLGERLPEPIETALVEKAGGNPFYLNEIVATLRSTGTLVLDDRGRWRVTGRVEEVLPETVHGAVLARLDRLPPAYRAVLQRAAVAGASFRQSLLEALSPEAGVAEALPALEEAFLIRRRDPLAADPEYTFIHPLLREVAYASLLAKQRTAMHRQVAEAMERLYPAQIDELAKTIGTHYLRAGCPDVALPHLIRAGEDAARRYAAREAIELLEEARRIAGETDAGAQCLPACELLGDLYLRVQDRSPKAWFEVWEFVRTQTYPQHDPIRH
ncbi:MAG: adenylate/guanylate cyclase domain-containing protein, partial [Armatimonadota bacterium]|nr:adenylate/guanylate cyclase domain-containing protein [Armatimonadota bacterium]